MSYTTITAEEKAYWRRVIDEDCLVGDNAKIWRLLDALEQAEARVKSRNNHIHRLLGEALESERNLDGMKSRLQEAEAENARLAKMVDWLAGKLSEHCLADGGDCNILICPTYIACRNATPKVWKEAARRAVADADSEVKA